VAVIENETAGVLREARGLLLERPLEALLLESDSERTCQKNGAVVQRFGIGV